MTNHCLAAAGSSLQDDIDLLNCTSKSWHLNIKREKHAALYFSRRLKDMSWVSPNLGFRVWCNILKKQPMACQIRYDVRTIWHPIGWIFHDMASYPGTWNWWNPTMVLPHCTLNRSTLPVCQSHYDLGVLVDDRPKFHDHIASVAHKVFRLYHSFLKWTVCWSPEFMLCVWIYAGSSLQNDIDLLNCTSRSWHLNINREKHAILYFSRSLKIWVRFHQI